MKITIPNIITSIRFIAIPFMAYYIYAGVEVDEKYNLVAFILFLSIWLTDVLDGYIARKYDQVTDFGKLFDPFVDKLFQFVAALMMAIVGKLPIWIPVVIAFKEIAIIFGGAILFRKYRMVVYAKWYGKLSTVLFVVAFCFLFFVDPGEFSKAVYVFVLPIGMSIFSYGKYFIDEVIPILNKKNKIGKNGPAPESGNEKPNG